MIMTPEYSNSLLANAGPAGWEVVGVLLNLLGYALFFLLPAGLVAWLGYFLLALPLRRQERARLFVDLLELILKQGRPVEPTLVELAHSRDRMLGMNFYLLAAYLEDGWRLGPALQKVPHFLPSQLNNMLLAGEELGDLRRVLPTCRQLLNDAQSSVRGATSYLVVLAFILSPATLLVLAVVAVNILPRFKETLSGMDVAPTPLFQWVNQIWGWLMLGQLTIFAGLLGAAVLYIGGPYIGRCFKSATMPVADWVAWHVPWKRRRMQRNFSALLAVLLDGGVPEAAALELAGKCAANEIFQRRSRRAAAALAQGTLLPEALAALDDRGEFRWRLANAVHAHGSFVKALTGWHEALDARAFQQEQAAAHAVTSALVLFNGTMVALVCIGIFAALISIINAGVLW